MAEHRLYGAELSLYSGKLRAYLRFKAVPYTEILSTAAVIRDPIEVRTGRKMVPVLESPDGEFLQDTTLIIDQLEARFPTAPVLPPSPRQALVASLLELYGDEWLLLPAMHYRWAYNRRFIVKEMGRMMQPDKGPIAQKAAAIPLVLYFGVAGKHMLGVMGKTARAIEASYQAFLKDFDQHLAEQPFLLGTRPSIADYGFMGPLYAHLYRDPASGALMKNIAPRVADWVERMNAPTPNSGEFLPGDQIPKPVRSLGVSSVCVSSTHYADD